MAQDSGLRWPYSGENIKLNGSVRSKHAPLALELSAKSKFFAHFSEALQSSFITYPSHVQRKIFFDYCIDKHSGSLLWSTLAGFLKTELRFAVK